MVVLKAIYANIQTHILNLMDYTIQSVFDIITNQSINYKDICIKLHSV